jgi:hypothetical protein
VSFEISAWITAGFMTFYGIFFLYLSRKTRENAVIAKVVNVRVTLFLFALFYLSISQLTIFTSMAYSIEYGNQSPCENVVANSTAVSSTITSYEYVDSCASRTVPDAQDGLLQWYTYLLWLEAFGVAFGAMFLFAQWVQRW